MYFVDNFQVSYNIHAQDGATFFAKSKMTHLILHLL